MAGQKGQRQRTGAPGSSSEFNQTASSASPAPACVCPACAQFKRGFKSPVYKMNIEEQKKLLAMKRTTSLSAVALAKEGGQLREGDRSWEGRLWENHQAMNKKSIRGRRGGMSWHNTAKSPHLAPEVNGTLGWWRIVRLPGERERSGHGGPEYLSKPSSNLSGGALRESGERPPWKHGG
jgi:hypothetical protein